jgi:hypothetical protein
MPPQSAAMELKVLISILQSGSALQSMLNQVTNLSTALAKLQAQANAAGAAAGTVGIGGGAGGTAAATAQANALAQAAGQAATAVTGAGIAAAASAPQMLTLEGAVNKVVRAVRFLAGGFLAFQSVRFIKNIADVAARTEVLNTVLHVVAVNAGYTEEQIDRVSLGVQRLGITAQSANQSLTQFMQAGLKIEFAEPLARAAQDLAVISGMDSSTTFQRLLVNIQQLDTLGLRHMGIIVSRTEAEAKYASRLDRSVNALSQREKQEALMNAVIEKARGLEGAYEAAMGNVGKQLTSLTRYTQELRSEIGKQLLPAYSAIISELSLFLAKMQNLAIASSANLDLAERLGVTVRWLAHQFFEAVAVIIDYREAIYTLVAAYASYWTLVTGRALWAHLTTVVLTLTEAVLGSARAIVNATKVTYAWIVALELLNRTRAVGAAQTAGQLSFDFMAPATQAGMLTRIRTWIAAMTEAGGVSLWLSRLWGGLSIGLRAVGAAFFSVETVIATFVVAAGIVGYWILKVTDLGALAAKSLGKLGDAFSRIAGLLSGTLGLAWRLLSTFMEATLKVAGDLTDTFVKLVEIMEYLPGTPLNAMKNGFTLLNIALDLTLIKLAQMREDLDRVIAVMERLGLIKAETGELLDKRTASLRDQLAAITTQLNRAMDQTKVAETAVITASKKYGRFSPEAKEAEDEFKKVKDVETKLAKERDKTREDLFKRSPAAVAEAERMAARNKALREFAALETQATDAAAKGLKVTVEKGRVQSKEFGEQFGQLKVMIDFYDAVKKNANESIDDISKIVPKTVEEGHKLVDEMRAQLQQAEDKRLEAFEKAKAALSSIQRPEDRADFLKQLERLRPTASPEQLKAIRAMEQTSAIQVREFLDPVFARMEAIRGAQFRAAEAKLTVHLEEQISLYRTASEEQAKVDKQAYDRGLMSLDEYYDRRITAAKNLQELELMQARQNLDAVKKEQASGLARRPEEIIALQQRRVEAESRVRTVQAAGAGAVSDIELARQAEMYGLEQQMYDLHVKNIAAFGTEEEALAELENEYEKRRKLLKDTPGAQAELDIEKSRAAYQIHLKYLDQALQDRLDEVKAKRESLDLDQALIGLDRARAEIAEKSGDITSAQAMQIRNALLLRQIAQDQAILQAKEVELRIKGAELAARTTAITDAQLGGAISAEEAAERLRALRALRAEVSGLEADVVNTNAAIESAMASFEQYGKQVRDSFVDSFASALSQTMVDFRKAGQAWVSFGQSIGREIGNIIAKNIAERIARALRIEQGINALFNSIPGFGGGGPRGLSGEFGSTGAAGYAAGGPVTGPGTGTSDSIPAMLSAGEHIMPAAQAARFMPLLEGIRTGRILPFAHGGVVQSIAISPIIPRRYAGGGVVMSDAGAGAVQTGNQGSGNMVVSLHPDALNMTMREWLEQEVVRQQGRR